MKSFIWATMWVLLVTLASQLQGQQRKNTSTCVIEGTVTNQKGTPLAYANIFLEGRMEGAMSNTQGHFSFKTCATGTFTLICSYIGYRTFKERISLKPGKIIHVDITLRQQQIETSPVIVTASSFTTADREGVTLTTLEVVTTPGAAADVFWAIKTYPGVQQVEEGAGLFVRGGDVSETITILDGAIVAHPYKYESPTGGFFGTFSPFLLKGTFFSSGGFSAQYGNALSGALIMESQDIPPKKQVTIGIGLAAESAKIDLPIIENKLGLSFSGNRSNTKMMFELNRSKVDFSQYPFAYDLNLNIMYRYSRDGYFKFFLFRETDKVGVEIADPIYDAHYHGHSTNQLYNLKFSNLINRVLIQGNLAFSQFDRNMNLSAMYLDHKDRLYQFRLSAEYELKPGFTLRSGLVGFKNQTLFTGEVPKDELDLNPDAETNRVETDYRSDRVAGFLEAECHTPFSLVLISGLRGEFESVSKDFILDPRISIIWPISAYSSLTAAWGIYHQYPNARYYDPNTGNPHLSSLQATHYIVGYTYRREAQIIRVEAYYKNYQNLLLKNTVKNYINEGYGYAQGVDVFVKKSFGQLSGWVSYNYLKARRKWLEYTKLTPPYFDITHNSTVTVKYSLSSRFGLGLGYRYATGKPYTPAPEQYNTARVSNYQKLDLSLSYLHQFFVGNITVFYLGLSNLFNRINIFDYRYSPDYSKREAVKSSFGRSVYFGISFSM